MRLRVFSAALVTAVVFSSPSFAQQNDLMKYCKADIQRLCKNVKPGDGRIMGCLKAHGKEMSVGCAQALQKMQAKAKK
ncbi:MAG: cysteine rich repeat-containing protein [Pseudochelatococcus sp.]|uniref:cysteine rich repeat-containing protein n=1 Tax=Pseudochelatococcus sp. TaxID=2020869 RepID=UPI003D8DBE48